MSGQCPKAEDQGGTCGKIPYQKDYRESPALEHFQEGRWKRASPQEEAPRPKEIGPERGQGDDSEEGQGDDVRTQRAPDRR